MKKEDVVPIEAWVRVTASNSDEAFSKALEELSSNLEAIADISSFGYVFNEPELMEEGE